MTVLRDTWLLTPGRIGEGSPTALDEHTMDCIAEGMWDKNLGTRWARDLRKFMRDGGATDVGRVLLFDADDLHRFVADPVAHAEGDEHYLAWILENNQKIRAEEAEVLEMSRPGVRLYEATDDPRKRRRRWYAHWLLHWALPEQFPAPVTPTIELSVEQLDPDEEHPRHRLTEFVGPLLAEGGHPLAAAAPVWQDELFYAEVVGRHDDHGRLLRLDMRVYLPAGNAWLPAAPWVTGRVERTAKRWLL